MIAHLVLFKPKPDLSTDDRRALILAFGRAVREVPTVRDVRIGRRVTFGASYEQQSANAAEFIVVIDFDDLSGLQTYLGHPAHEEISARFSQSLSSVSVYDFDVGGIETLERLV